MVVVSSNLTASISHEDMDISAEMLAVVIGMTLFSLFTILGNLLVLVAYFTNPSLQTTTNYFILSLAISDLAVGFISINFMTVYLLRHKWPFGHVACDILLSLDYSVCQASGFNIVAISFDRMIKVIHPMKRLKKANVRRSIVLLWIASFAIWFGSIFGYHAVYPDVVPSEKCHIPFLYQDKPLTVSTAVIHFYLPAILIIIVYMIVSLRLLQQHRRLQKNQANSAPNKPNLDNKTLQVIESRQSSSHVLDLSEADSPATDKEERTSSQTLEKPKNRRQNLAFRKILAHRRAITLLTIVSVAYVMTYLPYSLFTIITTYCSDLISATVWEFGYVFCYVNSLLNPFCYAIGNKKYRISFINIFRKIKSTFNVFSCYLRSVNAIRAKPKIRISAS